MRLLGDVNNVYVTARNLGLDPVAYLAALPAARWKRSHLAGHSTNDADGRALLIDDHGSPVALRPCGRLRTRARAASAPSPTLVEWDTELPPLETLLGECPRQPTRSLMARDARCGTA